MYNKIKRELYAADYEYEISSNQILHGRSEPNRAVFWLSNVQKMTIKNLDECTRQLTRMMVLIPFDLCAMIPNQQNFTRHDERFNFSTIFSGCQIGQVRVTYKSDQAQQFHLEVLPLRRIFGMFRLFSPNFRHFSPRFRRIQSWYRFHLHGARLLAGDFATKFDFCNVKFRWFVRYQMSVLIG